MLCRQSSQSGYCGTACPQFVPEDIEAGIKLNRSTWNVDLSRWTVALANEVLFFGLRGLALHRIGQLGVSACLGKTVALPTEEMLSIGLGGFALRQIGQCWRV